MSSYGTVTDPDGNTRAANKDNDDTVWYETGGGQCDWRTADTFQPYPAGERPARRETR
jgi:hypothetical protein